VNHEEIPVILHEAGFLILRVAADNDLIPVPSNANITGTFEEDHRSWMFVDSGFVRNFFYVDIEDRAGGEVNGLGVHKIAFKEKLDPTAVLGDPQDKPGSVFDRINNFVAAKYNVAHTINL
jgi:hypothetical protein